MSDTPNNLGEALPLEIERVQNMIPIYESVPEGRFAAQFMKSDVAIAIQATAQGDVIGMLKAYNSLKGYSL